MASVKIKGKKVTRTKKKDKITWLSKSAWKKALTVKAGAGDDYIELQEFGADVDTGTGDDKIWVLK